MGKMPESTFGDICTLALFWLLQYLILLGYVVYTVTYITGRELIYCANLALVHINRINDAGSQVTMQLSATHTP